MPWLTNYISKRLDHCQLPPTIHSVEADKKGLGQTLFAKVIKKLGDEVARMLNIQYR
jgi:ATP-dependent RNA/DNA helicase IGHMBP2